MTEGQGVGKAEALSGVRVLVHLAWLDGAMSPEEQGAIRPCLTALGLEEAAVDEFLTEEVELTTALEAVVHPKLRRAVMRAACALASAERMGGEGGKVLKAARRAWGTDVEDAKLSRDVERLALEDEMPMYLDPEKEEGHLARLMASWTLGIADLALSHDEVEARWRGRKTDIGELTRRLVRGEASAEEVAFKFKEEIGEV